MKTFITILSISFLLIIAGGCKQSDSNFRGQDRNGKYSEEKLLKEWPDTVPKLLHSITGLGLGYSSPAVTHDRIYLTGMIDSTGFLFSYDLNGNLLWKKAYGNEWTINYPGSRTTPTIEKDDIYFTNPYGKIYCYNKTGNLVWMVDMKKEFGFRTIDYGANESVLIEKDKLYCTPGGPDVMLAVLNRHNGETIKTVKGNGQKSAHCSPTVINHNGKKILITMTGQAAVGVDMESMEMLFQEEFSNKWGVNPNSPIYKDGLLYITTIKTGSRLLKMSDDGKTLTKVWENSEVDGESEGGIELDGYIYIGVNKKRKWYCVEMETGKIMYVDNKLIGRANVILADGLLYTYNTKGMVSLIKPNPEKLEVISQFKMEQGTREHIAHLVIKDGKLYVRHGDVMNIYDIAG